MSPSAEQWDAILADLKSRGIPTDEVTVISARRVTWKDGSLGCPQPGSTYTQAMVPGLQIVVAVAGVQYDYRFGRTSTPILCG